MDSELVPSYPLLTNNLKTGTLVASGRIRSQIYIWVHIYFLELVCIPAVRIGSKMHRLVDAIEIHGKGKSS